MKSNKKKDVTPYQMAAVMLAAVMLTIGCIGLIVMNLVNHQSWLMPVFGAIALIGALGWLVTRR